MAPDPLFWNHCYQKTTGPYRLRLPKWKVEVNANQIGRSKLCMYTGTVPVQTQGHGVCGHTLCPWLTMSGIKFPIFFQTGNGDCQTSVFSEEREDWVRIQDRPLFNNVLVNAILQVGKFERDFDLSNCLKQPSAPVKIYYICFWTIYYIQSNG